LKNLIVGEDLRNNKKHKSRTNSVGFCFLNIDDFTPEEAMHFLSGIVSFDICAIFETEKKLNKTYGIYAKPIEESGNPFEDMVKLINGFNDKFRADEYCTLIYSNKNFKLVKYSEDIWSQWEKREKQSELKWKLREE
jgi:hypothetical protein